jgi:hypothetical protein
MQITLKFVKRLNFPPLMSKVDKIFLFLLIKVILIGNGVWNLTRLDSSVNKICKHLLYFLPEKKAFLTTLRASQASPTFITSVLLVPKQLKDPWLEKQIFGLGRLRLEQQMHLGSPHLILIKKLEPLILDPW